MQQVGSLFSQRLTAYPVTPLSTDHCTTGPAVPWVTVGPIRMTVGVDPVRACDWLWVPLPGTVTV